MYSQVMDIMSQEEISLAMAVAKVFNGTSYERTIIMLEFVQELISESSIVSFSDSQIVE
jgi:hypothetical protein